MIINNSKQNNNESFLLRNSYFKFDENDHNVENGLMF